MKNSIKLFILTLFFVYSCSDNPVNNTVTNNPPTFQDSVIKLYSPSNNAHFYVGDTIKRIFSHSFAGKFGIFVRQDSNINFYATPNFTLFDTIIIDPPIPSSDTSSYYWAVIPYHWELNQWKEKPEYRSEIRRVFKNF